MVTELNKLTHAAASREGLNQFQHGSTLCGKGLSSGSVLLVPSFFGRALGVPTCRECREALEKGQQPVNETGKGHQVKADLKKVESIKSSLEAIRLEVGKAPKFAALAACLDFSISEASELSYSINEALNLDI
jgi:hypothetical protein